MCRIFISFISVLFISGAAYSNTRLLLHQSVNRGDKVLLLQDIASFDGEHDLIRGIKDIEIPSQLYSDGFIDKKEIYALLKNHSSELFFIYGSAVRVIRNARAGDSVYYDINEFLVKKGDRISFVIKKNGVHIEVSAVALDNGRMDDEVSVNTEAKSGYASRILKGRVRSRDIVEAAL